MQSVWCHEGKEHVWQEGLGDCANDVCDWSGAETAAHFSRSQAGRARRRGAGPAEGLEESAEVMGQAKIGRAKGSGVGTAQLAGKLLKRSFFEAPPEIVA